MGLAREFGPGVGVLLFIIIWLTRHANKLLKDLRGVYEEQVGYLRNQNQQLLDRLLGAPQQRPEEVPEVQKERAKALEKGRGSGGQEELELGDARNRR